MINRLSTMLLLLAMVAVLAPGSEVTAQDSDGEDELSPIQQQFVDEFGQDAVEYWNRNLADYKTIIDRTLSPNDLERLNKLRVQWSILMEQMMEKVEERKSISQQGDDTEVEVEVEMSLPEGTDAFSDVANIWMSAVALARNYRSGMDNVKEYVIEDVGAFADRMATKVEEFAVKHDAELKADKEGKKLLSEKSEIVDKLRGARQDLAESNSDFDEIYGFAVEPFIMLYNGGDLGSILPFVSQQTSSSVANGVAGMIPEAGVLKQNYPNPATTTTSIPFTLEGASSSTVIDLFDSEGGLVKSWDLGTVQPGDHNHEVDVENFTAGTYLYRLSVNINGEERIFSKVMKVVR